MDDEHLKQLVKNSSYVHEATIFFLFKKTTLEINIKFKINNMYLRKNKIQEHGQKKTFLE